jgi:AcrR family transcriptional regulator
MDAAEPAPQVAPQVSAGRRPRGRPRAFDREAALEKAVRVFWEQGYEATSVADLTRAMGIGAPSLYAAFGDKRALFTEVVAAYGERYGAFGRVFARTPTARVAVERMLHAAAEAYTASGMPRGCLVISAATNCSTPEVTAALREQREANVAEIRDRIAADVAAGELPAGTDAGALARYTGAVLQGMSQQARDGATAAELSALADLALRAWPEAPRPARK